MTWLASLFSKMISKMWLKLGMPAAARVGGGATRNTKLTRMAQISAGNASRRADERIVCSLDEQRRACYTCSRCLVECHQSIGWLVGVDRSGLQPRAVSARFTSCSPPLNYVWMDKMNRMRFMRSPGCPVAHQIMRCALRRTG